jgi:Ca2+-binding RTX toxin-like protein
LGTKDIYPNPGNLTTPGVDYLSTAVEKENEILSEMGYSSITRNSYVATLFQSEVPSLGVHIGVGASLTDFKTVGLVVSDSLFKQNAIDVSDRTVDCLLIGTGGTDLIRSGEGNDYIYGGDDDDVLPDGGSGNDLIVGGLGADTIDGGDGWDVSDYRSSNVGIDVDLARAAQIDGEAGGRYADQHRGGSWFGL